MAAKKNVTPVDEELIDEIKANEIEDEEDEDEDQDYDNGSFGESGDLTTVIKKSKPRYTGPRVKVLLPKIEEDGSSIIDQYEHVTMANEKGEEHYRVHRGEWVEVPVPVFMALKARYPEI